MAKKPPKPAAPPAPLSLHPLTPEQAIRGMFQIKPDDVRRIVGSKPGARKKKVRD